jgi:tetratricopeptide (TPR) repeat protein
MWRPALLGSCALLAGAGALVPATAAFAQAAPATGGAAPATAAAPAAPAAPEVPIGPVPAWFEMLPLPPPSNGAIDIRLRDLQLRFSDGGVEQVQRSVFRANAAEALQVVGRMVVVWDPGIETPVVNRLVVRRGNETIDVLARQSFSVLRRERQLESAVIDGQLTGFLQIADLRQGDEVEFIVTVKGRNPLLAGHSEALMEVGNPAFPTGRLRVRATWPEGIPMRWKGGPALPAAQQGKAGGERWMTIDASNFRLPEPPADAPARYAQLGVLALSDFADWQQVSALFAPVYDKSATIVPGSPLAAEADRIAAATTDPVRRAELALALVQSQVRYVADLAGLGGYQPAPAEAVWRDRLGDCKGKTVLLLGLLRRLGITAVPALVSVRNGDVVGDALPMPGRFDHVLVRASIGGKTYWLDGTRLGDTRLDMLTPPPVRWALPITQPGNGLVSLPPQAPNQPLEVESVEYTLSQDLDAPVKIKASMTYSGDSITSLAAALALIGPERAREEAKEWWRKRWRDFEVESADAVVDRDAGTLRFTATGTTTLEWSDGNPRTLTVPRSRVGINIAPERKPGPFADAPVAVSERYGRNEITILLPRTGFALEGEPIAAEAGGIRYTRQATLEGTRLTLTADVRSAAHEVTLAEAKAADITTDKLWDRKLTLRAPEKPVKAQPKAAAKPAKTSAKAPPTPAGTAPHEVSPELRAMGQASQAKAASGAFDEALAIIDAAPPAVQGDPDWAVLKVMTLMQAGRVPEANRVSEAALAKAPRNPATIKVRAQVLAESGRREDALILFDRLLVLEPDNAEVFGMRAKVRFDLEEYDGAIADYDVALQLQPQDEQRQYERITVYTARKDYAGALKASDTGLAVLPDSELLHAMRAYVLVKLDRKDDARIAIDRSLAIEPNANAYSLRALHSLSGSPEAEIADWEAVIRLEPGRAMTPALAKRYVAAGAYERLAKAYQAAHAEDPTDIGIINAASVLNDAAGKPEATLLMIDTALTLDQSSAMLYNERCWLLATNRLDLTKALADCDAALKLRPKDSAYLDSRGLVWLQKGQYDKALADYDASVAAIPGQTSAIYGRGLAKMMLKQPGWEADIAAARQRYAEVDADYAGYKLPFALPPAPKPQEPKPAAK